MYYLLIAILLIVPVIVLIVQQRKLNRRHASMEEASREYQGRVVQEGFGSHALVIQVDGVEGRVHFTSSDSAASGQTSVHFNWSPKGQIHVVPETVWQKCRKIFGVQDIETGNRVFDEAYLVQGKPAKWTGPHKPRLFRPDGEDEKRHCDLQFLAAKSLNFKELWYERFGP